MRPDGYDTCPRCGRNDAYVWAEHDAQGIYLGKVCQACVKPFLARFRSVVLTGYNQNDVFEDIGETGLGSL